MRGRPRGGLRSGLRRRWRWWPTETAVRVVPHGVRLGGPGRRLLGPGSRRRFSLLAQVAVVLLAVLAEPSQSGLVLLGRLLRTTAIRMVHEHLSPERPAHVVRARGLRHTEQRIGRAAAQVAEPGSSVHRPIRLATVARRQARSQCAVASSCPTGMTRVPIVEVTVLGPAATTAKTFRSCASPW